MPATIFTCGAVAVFAAVLADGANASAGGSAGGIGRISTGASASASAIHHAAKVPLTSAAACVVDGRATASCFGGGPHGVSSTDATSVLQSALSSNASYLLIDDISKPWVVRPLFLSLATDMVVELQPAVHILAKQNEFHGNQVGFVCAIWSDVMNERV
jgi:hypothetical protein